MQDLQKKPTVPTGKVNGAIYTKYDEVFSSTDESDDEIDYERDFVEAEMKKYATCMSRAQSVSTKICSVASKLVYADIYCFYYTNRYRLIPCLKWKV